MLLIAKLIWRLKYVELVEENYKQKYCFYSNELLLNFPLLLRLMIHEKLFCIYIKRIAYKHQLNVLN